MITLEALCALFVELSSFLQESANINCGKYFTCVEERALYISYERARAADYFGGFLELPRHLLRASLTSWHNPSIATSTPPMTSAARKASSGWISRLLSQPPEPFSYWTEPLLLWVKGRSIKLDNWLFTMWQVWEKGQITQKHADPWLLPHFWIFWTNIIELISSAPNSERGKIDWT